jgi:hypothetical protein
MRMLTVGVMLGCTLTTASGASAQARPGADPSRLIDGCSRHVDCDDGNPCTQNLCVAGICAPALPVLGCCYDGECTPLGGEGGASSEPVAPIIEVPPSGCSVDDDCEDGHPCTQNLCVAGECASLPVLGCCLDGVCASDNSGGAPSGAPVTAGQANGPESEGGKGGTASNTPAEEPANQAGASEHAPASHDAWAMEGGGCEMRAPTTHQAGFGLLGLGLAYLVWAERRRHRS